MLSVSSAWMAFILLVLRVNLVVRFMLIVRCVVIRILVQDVLMESTQEKVAVSPAQILTNIVLNVQILILVKNVALTNMLKVLYVLIVLFKIAWSVLVLTHVLPV